MARNYYKELDSYKPFHVATKLDSIRLKGSRPLPVQWVRNTLNPAEDERFVKPVANMCDYVAFHTPKTILCNLVPMDVHLISPLLVESTNRYSTLFKNKDVKCGICKSFPM
ncbi:Protein of unknown function [Gryllus bimaculatus]|nr:Protein of unknown function [Gryllus bimaculatus]